MRYENYLSSVLVEIIQIIRVSGIARYIRENPPGTVVEDRLATASEEAALVTEEADTQDRTEWQTLKTAITNWSGNITVDKLRPVIQKLFQRIEKLRGE